MNIKYNLGDEVYIERLWYNDEMHYNVVATIEGVSIDRHGIRYAISIKNDGKVPLTFYVDEVNIKGKVEE